VSNRSAAGATEVFLRNAAALLGTAPVALLFGVCLAQALPLAPGKRFTLAFLLVLPLWVTAMCVAFVARSAARAWLVCGLLTLALTAFAVSFR